MISKYNVDESFNLKKTLECGQCFHYKKEKDYYIVLGLNSIAKVWQENNILYIDSNDAQYWYNYFALDLNYNNICDYLIDLANLYDDSFAVEAIKKGKGIRILRQPFFETACSFILSQQNNIPRIRKMIFLLSDKYSSNKYYIDGVCYSCFPSADDLRRVSIDELKECGLGYRAEYLYDFVRNWDNIIDNVKFKYENDFKLFKSQKGIGDKVSNCICLYGFEEYDAFPIDVWMKKIIEKYYTSERKELKIPEKYAGILQQFMFYCERQLNSK